jgi:hypothetical protein
MIVGYVEIPHGSKSHVLIEKRYMAPFCCSDVLSHELMLDVLAA